MTLYFWLIAIALSFVVSVEYNDALMKAKMTANSSQTDKLSEAEPDLTTKMAFTTVTHHGNITVNETEILVNWFQFKNRFALQFALVFFMFGCVIFLCFIPGKMAFSLIFAMLIQLFLPYADEPMFDISYNKYDTNEITKYATTSNIKVAPGKTAKNTSASSSTAKPKVPAVSIGKP